MRTTHVRFGGALVLCFLVTVATGAAEEPKQGEGPPQVVKLSEKDSGGTVKVAEKAEIIIQLPDEGKAGHVWQVAKCDKAQLEPVGKGPMPETVPDTKTPPDKKEGGASQTKYAVFRFKALKSGELELHYAIPNTKDAQPIKPAKQFTLKVEVVPAK